jgi:hypothetical protein
MQNMNKNQEKQDSRNNQKGNKPAPPQVENEKKQQVHEHTGNARGNKGHTQHQGGKK